jgi:amino acid permease
LYVAGIGICGVATFSAIIAFWFIKKSPQHSMKASGISFLIHFVLGLTVLIASVQALHQYKSA